MLCRKGWKAVVVIVVAAGMVFRAEAELYPSLSVDTFPRSAEDITISEPDFSLINHYPEPHYLSSSNLPNLLADVPAQDLFTYRSSLDAEAESPIPKDTIPAWDSLWHGAFRVSIAAVPEPSSLALLGIGVFLLGARKLRPRK